MRVCRLLCQVHYVNVVLDISWHSAMTYVDVVMMCVSDGMVRSVGVSAVLQFFDAAVTLQRL